MICIVRLIRFKNVVSILPEVFICVFEIIFGFKNAILNALVQYLAN